VGKLSAKERQSLESAIDRLVDYRRLGSISGSERNEIDRITMKHRDRLQQDAG